MIALCQMGKGNGPSAPCRRIRQPAGNPQSPDPPAAACARDKCQPLSLPAACNIPNHSATARAKASSIGIRFQVYHAMVAGHLHMPVQLHGMTVTLTREEKFNPAAADSTATNPPSRRTKPRFQLAMDRPSISHGTSSQRTTGAAMIWFSNSCAVSPPTDRPPIVQLDGPSHQPRSTPVW